MRVGFAWVWLVGFAGIACCFAACTPPEDEPASTPRPRFEMPEGWRTDITHHPRLHPNLDEAGRTLLEERITREPYATLWARIATLSDRTPADTSAATELHAPTAYANADIARAAAFRAWLTGDAAYRDKAVTILSTLVPDVYSITDPGHAIHLADALVGVATVWDLLLGIGITAEERAAIRPRLEQLADTTWRYYAADLAFLHALNPSNHGAKTAAGVGMLALVLNDHPEAYRWMAYAVTQLDHIFRTITSSDGVVHEGPYYHLYSALTHLPFLLAYDRVAGAEPMLYPPVCALRVDEPDCDERYAERYASPLSWDLVRAQHAWGRRIRMPDGTRPPFDDSFRTGFFGGLLDDARARWDWLNTDADPLRSGWTVDLATETLLRFDDDAPVQAPEGPATQFLTGAAVLRNGWGPEDSYVFVTGESGLLRETGHDHEDEGSFSLFAEGEYLLIDPGYVRWADRELVSSTASHNLILVDGEGAPRSTLLSRGGVDGFVSNGIDSAGFDYVETGTAYAGMELERRLALVEGLGLVVADRVRAAEEHEYTWMLHGWGGGSDGGTADLLSDGATWTRNGAALDARLVHDGTGGAFDFTDSIHGFDYAQTPTHKRLDLTATAANWQVLAVLLPRAEGDAALPVRSLDAGPGALAQVVEDGDLRWVTVFDPTGTGPRTVAEPEPGCGGFEADGELTVARIDCGSGERWVRAVRNGTLFRD